MSLLNGLLVDFHWMGFVDDSMPDTLVRNSFGGWIYAVLLHLPIFESSIPCCAAVVAAPILKL